MISPLQETQIRPAAQALTQAFLEYDLYQYFFKKNPLSPVQLNAFMEGFISLMLSYRHVYCGPNPQDGVALFLPPEVFDIPTLKALPYALRQAPRAGLSYLLRMLPISHELNAKRPKVPHWYLIMIGVAPHAQRQGLGRRLMQPVLQKADAAAQPVYLETTMRSNLDFYAGLGFQLQDHFHCHRGRGPETWCMFRPPRISVAGVFS